VCDIKNIIAIISLAATLNEHLPMKIIIGLFALTTITNFLDQPVISNQSVTAVQKDTSSPSVIFFDHAGRNVSLAIDYLKVIYL
jgi:hypothetical protein